MNLRNPIVAAMLSAALCACGGNAHRVESPNTAVRLLAEALRGNDPARVYELLSATQRTALPYDEFEKNWKATELERHRRARALVAAANTVPAKAHARVLYRDSKFLELATEAHQWRLRVPLTGHLDLSSPRAALVALRKALKAQRTSALVAVLAQPNGKRLRRRTDALIEGLTDLDRHFIQMLSESRAELWWSSDSGRFRIELIRDNSDWRVTYVHAALVNAPTEDSEN